MNKPGALAFIHTVHALALVWVASEVKAKL